MSRSSLLAAVACALLGCARSDSDLDRMFPPSRDRHASRAAAATVSARPLECVEPIRITHAGITPYGHYYVQFRDAHDVAFHARQAALLRGGDTTVIPGDMVVRRETQLEVAIVSGTPLEQALYGVLVRWAEQHPIPSRLRLSNNATEDERTLYYGHAFLNVMDWRFAPSRGIHEIQ